MAEESIADFVHKHANEPLEQVLQRVLENPRVKSWVGDDAQRRKRVEEEVTRAYATRPGASKPAPPAPAPAAKSTAPSTPSTAVVGKRPAPSQGPAAPAKAQSRVVAQTVGHAPTGKREAFMCLHCFSPQIYSDWRSDHITVRCRGCGTEYDDMLKLIPIREVGPFEFLLGTGRMRTMRIALILAAWVGLFALLVFLR